MAKDIHYTDPSRQSGVLEYDNETAAEYVNSLQPIKDGRRRKKRNRILAVVLFLAVTCGVAGYFFLLKPDKPDQRQGPQTAPPQPVEEQVQIAKPKKFVSQDMNLSFEYPGNWNVDDSMQGLIQVESPVVKLADGNGEQSDAKVVVSFLSTGSEVPGFGESSATATRDSEKITYSAPSQNQRAKTYLSFAAFGRSGIDAVFITGDNGYQTDQLIPESDIKKGDPIISVTFNSCDDADCGGEGSGAYTIQPDEWDGNEALQAVQALLKSLRVE